MYINGGQIACTNSSADTMQSQQQVPPDARRMLELSIIMAALDPARCPITGRVTNDPVILAGTGLSYDRAAITAYFEANGAIDPATGNALDEQQRRLLPNPALARMVDDMIARFLELWRQIGDSDDRDEEEVIE